jgi:hypothetical protein
MVPELSLEVVLRVLNMSDGAPVGSLVSAVVIGGGEDEGVGRERNSGLQSDSAGHSFAGPPIEETQRLKSQLRSSRAGHRWLRVAFGTRNRALAML